MVTVLDRVATAAATEARVLVTGESGVGKDLVAREIHRRSPRGGLPFVALNCAGVTDTLLESELFGVRSGLADTDRSRPGKLQQADRGTLFVDEVGDTSPRMQALLLRFLDDGLVQAVGPDETSAPVDVRIIAATQRDLPEMVRTGAFRADLCYRLRVLQIPIPPLRERPDDIPRLVGHFAAAANRSLRLSPSALRLLVAYAWPGNVRELRNVVDQMLWLGPGSRVDAIDLPDPIRSSTGAAAHEPFRQPMDALFEGLLSGACTFWHDVHAPFLSRDLTRSDVRELVARGLRATGGHYRELVRLFRIPEAQYGRFMKFLVAFDCKVDFRAYRASPARSRHRALPRRETGRPRG